MRNESPLRSLPYLAWSLLSCFWATSGAAQDPGLLENANFDTTTNGWTVDTGVSGSLSWSTGDASGSPHSGSARLTAPPNGDVLVMGEPCLVVQAGEQYVLSGSVWIDEASSGDRVWFGFADFNDSACSRTLGFGLQVGFLAEAELDPGRWQDLAASISGAGETRWLRPALWIQSAAGDLTAHYDRLRLRSGRCAPGPTTLCLNDDRFEVTASWRTAQGNTGQGRAVPFAADSGSFWFFSDTNLELDVKVLNGCGLNGHFWVFAAGLTDVEIYLQVRDTETETYWASDNPLGRTFVTVTDTGAFDTCPP